MSRGRHAVRLKVRPLPETAKALLLEWESGELYQCPEKFPKLSSIALFGNEQPLEVEIGSGSGEFLCDLAARQPDRNFLGIEVSKKASTAFTALADEQNLSNVRVLRADFKLLGPLLPEAGWAKVYLHFPDPPYKTGDQKQRIFTQSFLDKMTRSLVPQGEISVASDLTGFFFEMLELAEGDSRYRLAHPERYLEGLETNAKSRFQRLWESKGVSPLRFVIAKVK